MSREDSIADGLTAFTEEARQLELERALGLLKSGKEPADVMETLSRRLTNKLMHAPTKALRAAGEDRHTLATILGADSSVRARARAAGAAFARRAVTRV